MTRPNPAYSETTAFPANRLSAQNMAAKLAVSTISDVPQHDVHERQHGLPAGALAEARPGHETPRRTAPPDRRPPSARGR